MLHTRGSGWNVLLPGRRLSRVIYVDLPGGLDEPVPFEGVHRIAFGVDLVFDSALVVSVTWSRMGGQLAQFMFRSAVTTHEGNPLELRDVSGKAEWREVIGQSVEDVAELRVNDQEGHSLIAGAVLRFAGGAIVSILGGEVTAGESGRLSLLAPDCITVLFERDARQDIWAGVPPPFADR